MAKVAGKFLTARRKERRISRAELARIAGVGHVTIWRMERGRMRNPRLSSLEKIARALDLPLAQLLMDGKAVRDRTERG
jgi:transcriptional regulator with XRE-family HTH domain